MHAMGLLSVLFIACVGLSTTATCSRVSSSFISYEALEADSDAEHEKDDQQVKAASGDKQDIPALLQKTQPDTLLNVMVYWKIKDMSNFIAAIPGFIYRTKKEKEVAQYSFAINGNEGVCHETYTSAEAFLAHLKNVDGQMTWAQSAGRVYRVEAHGPQVEVDKLRKPLAKYKTEYWHYVVDPTSAWAPEWAPFYFPAKYASSKTHAPYDTVAMLVHWKVLDMGAFIQSCADFAAKTKQEMKNKHYGFTVSGDRAVCREGYTNANGFLEHLTNVDAELKASSEVATITKVVGMGPRAELDKLRNSDKLKGLPTSFWDNVDEIPESGFYVPAIYARAPAKAVAETASSDGSKQVKMSIRKGVDVKILKKISVMTPGGRATDVAADTVGTVLDVDDDGDAKLDLGRNFHIVVFAEDFDKLEVDEYSAALGALAKFTDKITIRDRRYLPSWEGGIANKKAYPQKKQPLVFNSAPKRPQKYLEAMALELGKNLKDDKALASGKVDFSLYHEKAIYKSPEVPTEGVPADSVPDLAGDIKGRKSDVIVLDEPSIIGNKIIFTIYIQLSLQIHPISRSYFTGVAEYSFEVHNGLVTKAVLNYVDYASGPPGQRKSVSRTSLISNAIVTFRRPNPHRTCMKFTKGKGGCK